VGLTGFVGLMISIGWCPRLTKTKEKMVVDTLTIFCISDIKILVDVIEDVLID